MKVKRIVPIALVVLAAGFYFYMNPLLPIITGYAAKNLSSGIFVAGRTQESLEGTDLNFSFIKYVKNKVDHNKKQVKSRFLWHTSTAVYIDGYGCSLVNDVSQAEMKSRNFAQEKLLPENPDTILWPMGNLLPDSIPGGIDYQKLEAAINQSFVDTIPFKGTFSVMVVYKGYPVIEKYKDGFNSETKFLSWSMAKSITNAMIGILQREGKIDIFKPTGIQDWQNDDRKNITIANLMHMNSGLEWNEDYGNNSDVNIMLHKVGDMARYTINKPLEYTPDSVWVYSSGSTNIVCSLIMSTFDNMNAYYAFPRKELFNKIGMRSALFEVDASGNFVGSSYVYATMRDYARFGLFFLNNGNWLGEQILPNDWVRFTREEAPGSKGEYGAFFWINKAGVGYPDVPADMYCCRGHDGQYIYIIPSKELVVVRTGFSKKGNFDYNKFLADIVDSFE
jgi:CubicO group peptidase (beta-lactamase class C family)